MDRGFDARSLIVALIVVLHVSLVTTLVSTLTLSVDLGAPVGNDANAALAPADTASAVSLVGQVTDAPVATEAQLLAKQCRHVSGFIRVCPDISWPSWGCLRIYFGPNRG